MPTGKLGCFQALPRRKQTSERWKDRGRGLLTAALSLCYSPRQESIIHSFFNPAVFLRAHSGPSSGEEGLGASTCFSVDKGRQEPRTAPGTDCTGTLVCCIDHKKHVIKFQHPGSSRVSVCHRVNGT